MSGPSRLIQPLISTEALSTLKSLVPAEDFHDGEKRVSALTTRALGFRRFKQVILTSIPLVFADLAGLVACYLVSFLTTFWLIGVGYYPGLWSNLGALCFCHLLVGNFLGLFPASGMNPVCELRAQLTSLAISFVLLIALNGIVGEVTRNELMTIVLAFPLAFVVMPVARFCTRKIFAQFRWWGEKVIILGDTNQSQVVFNFLDQMPQRGLKPLGIMTNTAAEYWEIEPAPAAKFLGTTSELIEVCRAGNCYWVIAAVANKSPDEVRQILTQGSLVPNLVILNTGFMIPSMWVGSFESAGLSGIHVRDRLLFPVQRMAKRIADVVFSAILLLMLAPLFAAIGLWVRSKSNGPVLFRHQRIGRSGRPFGAWKFRTMVPDATQVLSEYLAENAAARLEWERFHKLKNDPRVIKGIGEFLRRSSLDEIPQLWNVLMGDMSLVGPRPVYTIDEINMYGDLYPLYLRVRPGLTGLWQVSGRNNTTFADKVWLDTYYAMNWSLWLDYFILLRTVRTVLFREGSY